MGVQVAARACRSSVGGAQRATVVYTHAHNYFYNVHVRVRSASDVDKCQPIFLPLVLLSNADLLGGRRTGAPCVIFFLGEPLLAPADVGPYLCARVCFFIRTQTRHRDISVDACAKLLEKMRCKCMPFR